MATKIPEEVIDSVRDGVNIADVVGQYVQLKKSGKNLFGLCPFHEERTASFSVNEDKQIFHCFSCGRGGNVFRFIMEIENLSFPQAILKVAADAGITVPEQYQSVGQSKPVDTKQGKLIELHEQAAKLYHHILVNTDLGKPALAYLNKRGMSDATINQFNIGYAPNSRLLLPFFTEKKIDYQEMRQSGLFGENETGQLHDRFVDRVMFPIRDDRGATIAFSGRLLSTEQTDMPKYLNSPETEIFNKRRTLFNFDVAKKSARKTQDLILFEGFMDVIAATSAGVTNGIASMGTSLTEEQVNMVERVTSNIQICYDGDSAGQNATKRAIELISNQSNRLEIGVIAMPSGIDPDEFLQQNGQQAFQDRINDARETPIAFQMRFLRHGMNLDNEADQLDYLNSALKLIGRLSQPIEQDIYLNQLATQFNLDKDQLKRQLHQIAQNDAALQNNQRQVNHSHKEKTPVYRHQVEQIDQVQLAEKTLLKAMLNDHDVWLHVQSVDGFSFAHEQYQTLYLLAGSYFAEHQTYQVAEFSDFIDDEQLRQLLIEIDLMDGTSQFSLEAANDCMAIIMKKAPLKQQIQSKKAQLREATHLNNEKLQQQLTIELVELLKQQQQI